MDSFKWSVGARLLHWKNSCLRRWARLPLNDATSRVAVAATSEHLITMSSLDGYDITRSLFEISYQAVDNGKVLC